MFLVYDRTGKELLLAKAMLRLRAEEKEAPVLSQVTIEACRSSSRKAKRCHVLGRARQVRRRGG